jgi:hypothetical protein
MTACSGRSHAVARIVEPTSSPRSSSVSVSAHGLGVRVTLDATSARAGQAISGHLYVANNTGHPITTNCTGWVQIALTNAHVPPNFRAIPTVLCPRVGIAVGESTLTISLETTYFVCTQSSDPSSSVPACVNTRPPALPPGVYHTVMSFDLPKSLGLPKPQPITIIVAS